MIDTNADELVSSLTEIELQDPQQSWTVYLARERIKSFSKELDRLYHDHTPLSRKELETVLKEEGIETNGDGDFENNAVLVQIFPDKVYWETDSNYAALPLSAVTRATLRSCGVIK